MVSVDAALLIEGLFADVADVCIGEVLIGFEFESRDVVDVGG